MKKLVQTIAITFLVLFAAGAANAALVTQNFTGQITMAVDANLFGVAQNDMFSWTTTYDLSGEDPDGYLLINRSADYQLRTTIGNRTFIETEDDMYGAPFSSGPILLLAEDNTVNGMSFVVTDSENGYSFKGYGTGFTIYLLDADGTEEKDAYITGTFSFDPVPVPSAIVLLGAGLAGLAGLRRKN